MAETVNKDLLILAREVRGLDQTELANKLGMSPSKLCKIESGTRGVSSDDLGRIAAELRFPREFFYRPSPRRALDSGCFYHRKRQSLTAKHLRRIHAELDWRQIHIEQLLSGIAIDGSISGFGPIDADEFEGDVDAVARMIRSRWRLRPGPIDNLTREIERFGGVVIPTRFGSDKIDAISQISPPLPALFYVNDEIPSDRVRLTLAHEIGHLVMHNGPSPLQDIEGEANRFAAEFLMPAADIKAEFARPVTLQSLIALKYRWKVSIQALVHRAQDLGVVTESQARWLYVQIGKRGWKKKEPHPLEPEQPTILRDVLSVYQRQLGWTLTDFGQRTGTLPDDFAHIYMPGAVKPRLVS